MLLLRKYHSSPTGGHFGVAKCYVLLKHSYFWPKMLKDVKIFIKSCLQCQQNKVEQKKLARLLQPLPIPNEPWESISMDFIMALPQNHGQSDAILVIVARLSNQAHFVPTHSKVDAPGVATLFYKEVYHLHGLPQSIISDRDIRFTSHFWQSLFQIVGTKFNMNTGFHSQTDGQTERVNRVLEELIRAYVAINQTDWVDCLPRAEFAYNYAVLPSTQKTPFEVVYGKNPLIPSTLFMPNVKNPAASAFLNKWQANLQLSK
jgi:hypothetical protein